jgi:hypothetical protein
MNNKRKRKKKTQTLILTMSIMIKGKSAKKVSFFRNGNNYIKDLH